MALMAWLVGGGGVPYIKAKLAERTYRSCQRHKFLSPTTSRHSLGIKFLITLERSLAVSELCCSVFHSKGLLLLYKKGLWFVTGDVNTLQLG